MVRFIMRTRPRASMATKNAGEVWMSRSLKSRSSRRARSARFCSEMSRRVAIMATGSPASSRTRLFSICVGKTLPSRATCQISPLKRPRSWIARLARSTAGICSGVWKTDRWRPVISGTL